MFQVVVHQQRGWSQGHDCLKQTKQSDAEDLCEPTEAEIRSAASMLNGFHLLRGQLVLTWLTQRSIRLRVISMYADARQLSIVHVRPRIPGKGKEKGALSIARMGLRRKQYCWEPGSS